MPNQDERPRPSPRRFPPPWHLQEHPESFAIVDATGQNLAFVYYEERARPAHDHEAPHEGRGPADRGEHRPPARTTAIKTVAAVTLSSKSR